MLSRIRFFEWRGVIKNLEGDRGKERGKVDWLNSSFFCILSFWNIFLSLGPLRLIGCQPQAVVRLEPIVRELLQIDEFDMVTLTVTLYGEQEMAKNRQNNEGK